MALNDEQNVVATILQNGMALNNEQNIVATILQNGMALNGEQNIVATILQNGTRRHDNSPHQHAVGTEGLRGNSGIWVPRDDSENNRPDCCSTKVGVPSRSPMGHVHGSHWPVSSPAIT